MNMKKMLQNCVKWIKFYKKDKDCYKFIEIANLSNNKLQETINRCIKLDCNRVPVAGQLKKLGVKVIAFKKVEVNDVYVGKDSVIHKSEVLNENMLNIPGEKPRLTSDNMIDSYWWGGKRFILGNIVETENTDELKVFAPDGKAKAEIEKCPLSQYYGQSVPMAYDNVPVDGVLENIGVEVVGFRIPTCKDFFITQYGTISSLNEDKSVDLTTKNGHRLILGNITQNKTSKD